MSSYRVLRWISCLGLVVTLPACATAQKLGGLGAVRVSSAEATQASSAESKYVDSTASSVRVSHRRPGTSTKPTFRSRKDSLEYVAARSAALKAQGYRLVVSLTDKMLWVIDGADTLRAAEVAVGMGQKLEYGSRSWFFETPRGQRRVLRKEADPRWRPPVWAYAEVAKEYGLKMKAMPERGAVVLKDGARLMVRDSVVGIVDKGQPLSSFEPLPLDEHIVFDGVLYIPPSHSKNRMIEGELGKFRLDLGEGYLLHGTPHQDSIGQATTHGCVRLRDEDIEWLYNNVPVGSKVYIY
jgi:hypothetical protein